MTASTDALAQQVPRSAARIRVGRREIPADPALGVALAALLALIAFVTTGGETLAPNTWTEIVLVAAGTGLAVTMLLTARRELRVWGGVTFALFAALAALTAVSTLWSVQPQSSWVEANRTLSYLAVFGSGVALARLLPARHAAVLGALALAATAISGYALLIKIFPATFDANDTFGRLRAPFDYWNATGLMAALGLTPCLWAGARKDRGRAARAVAVPAISLLLTVIVLSYSRGALLVSVIGLVCWFATVPLRLRAALVLAVGAAGAAVLTIFALSTHALTHDQVPLASRTTAGHAFGVVVVLTLSLSTAGGFVAAFGMDRVALTPVTRRRIGAMLLVLVALMPVGGVVTLAASSRGPAGEVSHLWNTLTNPNSGASNTPTRLVTLGNARGRYWSEGLKVGEHALLKGVGALGYATAVTRYTSDTRIVPHAHSFVIQTFADFGLIGIALMLALLAAWAGAARRAVTAPVDRVRAPERVGLLTMLAVVVTFGAHSAIDWTWFIPGTAIPALLCAGWLAGRGPLSPRERTAMAPRLTPGALGGSIAVVAVALLCVWMMWQPLRANDATSAAVASFSDGNTSAAIADARSAADEDPVTVDPLLELAAIYSATGQYQQARHELRDAVARQPENPQTWLALGQFDLARRQIRAALSELQRAQSLDQGSTTIAKALAQALAAR